MTSLQSDKSLADQIMRMDRQAITRALLSFRGRVPLDFTEEFLSRKSTDWLRHVLLAAILHCK